MSRCVLDASAILAVLLQEPGHEKLTAALLSEAVARGKSLGLKTLLYVSFAHNNGSMHLAESLGFMRWGHLPAVAEMDGIERDVAILGHRLT